jgi:hypothetical protein
MMSKFPNNTVLSLIPLTLLGIIQLASVSPKLMQLDIQTPVGGVSFNTSENGIKHYRKLFFRDSKRC